MIQDDFGNLIPSSRTATLNERLEAGDVRMRRIEDDVSALRRDLQALKEQLAELLEFFSAMTGAFKVLRWIGALAKPVMYIVGLGTACAGLWAALKSGVHPK